MAVMVLPEPYRKRLRTTNSVERLNEEIRASSRIQLRPIGTVRSKRLRQDFRTSSPY